ncbi:unnamed protein product [Chrysoparadoxa australica]
MITSKDPSVRLALNIIAEHFGDIVRCVGEALVRSERCTLRVLKQRLDEDRADAIRDRTPLPAATTMEHIHQALGVLLQHHCLDVLMPTAKELEGMNTSRVLLRYRLRVDTCLERIRFQRYLQKADAKFGEWGRRIVLMLGVHGKLTFDQLRSDTLGNHLAGNMADQEGGKVRLKMAKKDESFRETKKALMEMIRTHHIVRLQPLNLTKPSPPPNAAPIKKGMDFLTEAERAAKVNPAPLGATSASTANRKSSAKSQLGHLKVKRRRKVSDDDIEEDDPMMVDQSGSGIRAKKEPGLEESPPRKKAKQDKLTSRDPDIDPAAIWCLGSQQFMRDFRHDAMTMLVKNKFKDNEGVQAAMRAITKVTASKEVKDNEQMGAPFTIQELTHHMPQVRNKTPSHGDLRRYLHTLVSEHLMVKTSMPPELNEPDQYQLDIGHHMMLLRRKSLHSMLVERYGDGGARIFQVLLEKKYLEQGTISESCMMPPKECREKLYQLYRDRFVSLQEVSKRGDHNPSTTIYLWSVKSDQVQRTLLDLLHKGILNVRMLRKVLKERESSTLDNKKRITSDEEIKKYNKVLEKLDRLDLSQCKLDDSLMLFKDF